VFEKTPEQRRRERAERKRIAQDAEREIAVFAAEYRAELFNRDAPGHAEAVRAFNRLTDLAHIADAEDEEEARQAALRSLTKRGDV